MARALIVGCGCRGRGARASACSTRAGRCAGRAAPEEGLAAIEAAGIEAALADPDRAGDGPRPGRRRDASSSGCSARRRRAAEELAAIHGPRLERLLEKLVDTPVRGFVYEAAGSVEPDALERGAAIVRERGRALADPGSGRSPRIRTTGEAWIGGDARGRPSAAEPAKLKGLNSDRNSGESRREAHDATRRTCWSRPTGSPST